jgi:hypothetical protein
VQRALPLHKLYLKANTFEVKANTFEVKANKFEVEANTFEVKANTFEVEANTFEVEANTFEVEANKFEVTATGRWTHCCRGGQGGTTDIPESGDCCDVARVTLPGAGVALTAGVQLAGGQPG